MYNNIAKKKKKTNNNDLKKSIFISIEKEWHDFLEKNNPYLKLRNLRKICFIILMG